MTLYQGLIPLFSLSLNQLDLIFIILEYPSRVVQVILTLLKLLLCFPLGLPDARIGDLVVLVHSSHDTGALLRILALHGLLANLLPRHLAQDGVLPDLLGFEEETDFLCFFLGDVVLQCLV